VAGGGARTDAWYGMYYAGEVGRRLPVPIFQAIGDFAIFGILLLVERRMASRGPRVASDGTTLTAVTAPLPPAGILIGIGMVLWGIERFLDEQLWLHGTDGALGSFLVQLAGVALVVVGLALLATRLRPYREWRDSVPDPPPAIEPASDSMAGDGTATGAAEDRAEVAPVASTPGPGGSVDGD